MLEGNKFSTPRHAPYGSRMGASMALDPIDARDGFSKANPETFGPRALDAKKEQLAIAAQQAKNAAAVASGAKLGGATAVDPGGPSSSSSSSTAPLLSIDRAKAAAPYVAAAIVVTFLVVRYVVKG